MAGRKGRSGRRPKKPHLHVVTGTHRPDRHGDKEEIEQEAKKASAGRPPYAPSWLTDLAKREWRRISKLLHENGLLEKLDIAALASYCQAYADHQEATRLIDQDGYVITGEDGRRTRHPATMIVNQAAKRIREFGIEFGLSPSSRHRLEIPTEKPRNSFDDFVSGREADTG